MARTIFGCVNFATKTIEFDDSAECDGSTVTGCIEDWSATPVVVKVTHSECTLDDDEACVDFSTGKFEVVVQDDCCEECVDFANMAGSDISVTFSGIADCGATTCNCATVFNGNTFVLSFTGIILGTKYWYYTNGNTIVRGRGFAGGTNDIGASCDGVDNVSCYRYSWTGESCAGSSSHTCGGGADGDGGKNTMFVV